MTETETRQGDLIFWVLFILLFIIVVILQGGC